MLNLVSLLVAVALVSQQCGFEASAQIDNSNLDLDNNIQPHVKPAPKQIPKYVHIFQRPPETVQHVPGQQLELICQIRGSPTPSVTWLKNGEVISDMEEDTNEILSPYSTSIGELSSKLVLTMPANGDVYTCVGSAGVKKQAASTTVYTIEDGTDLATLEKLLRMPSKPIITASYDNVIQDQGTNLLLPCRVHSFSKVQVTWLDNQNNIVYGNPRFRILPSGDLLIIGLQWADMGNFTCNVKNAYGRDEATTFIYPTKKE